MNNLRTLTQEDVDKMIAEEAVVWARTGWIDWNLIASDVYNMVCRMRRRDIIDEIYGLEEMIDKAIDLWAAPWD